MGKNSALMNTTRYLALVWTALLAGNVGFPTPARAASATVRVEDLRCEYLQTPLGLDVPQPRLSWKLAATRPNDHGQRQTAYQILVASSPTILTKNKGDVWDSREAKSDQSVLVPYAGPALQSGQCCWWKVRVRDQKGVLSDWSSPACWSMGLLKPEDWKAQWIGSDQVFTRKPGWPPPDCDLPDPWFRKSFELAAAPVWALAYVASIGYHELYINGHKVGDGVLEPCATDHKHRARYVTYDIAPWLRPGKNVIGVWLGTAWSIFPPYKTDDKPQAPIVMAQAEIELQDGTSKRVATDGNWRTRPSPSKLLGVWDFMHYGGELYDGLKEIPDWSETTVDDTDWEKAAVFQPKLKITPEKLEPNRLVLEMHPAEITESAPGVYRVDMGVNFAGWTEVKLRGHPGDRIDFRYSERPETNMTHRHFSACIIGRSGQTTFRNRFNYSSGRWIEIRGLGYKPALEDVRGWLVRTDYARAAQFDCNLPLLNRIYDTTLWTFENLSLGGYLVDCPQRERMGYGGDAHSTTPTGLNNYQLGAFYTKWIQDWRDVQGTGPASGVGSTNKGSLEAGNLPYTAPTYWGGGGPGWSGFCVTLPWSVYRQYGDLRILEQNFPMIQHWLEFLETKATNNLLHRWGGEWDFLGDWLWPGAKGVNGDTVDTLFFNNCYWIYNLQTASQIAAVLGQEQPAAAYRQRAEQVRAAVHARFFNATENSYVNGFPAYLALALLVNVPPEPARVAVWKRLEDEILINHQGHIWAGITGGAFLFKALMEAHRDDLLYAMVSKEDYPGWGDMLRRGATTMWEDWEGRESLLHSSYLYVGAWFGQNLAGIQLDPQTPGFKRFVIRPALGIAPELQRVSGSYESCFGRIASEWEVRGGKFRLKATVPPNTTATLLLPLARADSLKEGGRALRRAPGVTLKGQQDKTTALELEPGTYSFESDWPQK